MFLHHIRVVAWTIVFVVAAKAQNRTNETLNRVEDNCSPVPQFVIQNETRRLECCQVITDNLYKSWTTQEVYLSSTLATLQAWNCPQFDGACANRTLDFSPFTSLMYDRFCDEAGLLAKCENKVTAARSFQANSNWSDSGNQTWNNLIKGLSFSEISLSDLEEPCLQVALYDAPSSRGGNYHEVVIYAISYCSPAWCGYDTNTINTGAVTPWACLPVRCRANVSILMAVFILMALVITVANLTVILVYGGERKMRHSQGTFRIALGVGDFLVGAIVFPCSTYLLYKTFTYVVYLLPAVDTSGLVSQNASGNQSLVAETLSLQFLPSREATFDATFSKHLTGFVGFIMTASLTASVYLLSVSGIDRLQALSNPVTYRQDKAKRFARIASVITWICAIVVALIPFFVNGLEYEINSSNFVTLLGRFSLITYAVAFFVPLFATWVISIGVYVVSNRNFKKSAGLSVQLQQNVSQHQRLNRILALMVTAFSMSVLPSILILIIVIFFTDANPLDSLNYDVSQDSLANGLELTATLILLSNSLWNCLIYSARNKNFRKDAAEIYRTALKALNPACLQKGIHKCTAPCCRKASSGHAGYDLQASVSNKRGATNTFNTSENTTNVSNNSPFMQNNRKLSKSVGQTQTPKPNVTD